MARVYKTTTVHLAIPRDLLAKLDATAKSEQRTRVNLILLALRQWANAKGK